MNSRENLRINRLFRKKRRLHSKKRSLFSKTRRLLRNFWRPFSKLKRLLIRVNGCPIS